MNNYNVRSSKCEKHLYNNIDNKLNFNTNVDGIRKKAGQKLNALSRATPYMDLSEPRIRLNAFFISQINHNCGKNNKINQIHER